MEANWFRADRISKLVRCGQSKLTEMVMGKPLVRLNRLNLALDLPLHLGDPNLDP